MVAEYYDNSCEESSIPSVKLLMLADSTASIGEPGLRTRCNFALTGIQSIQTIINFLI